MKTLFASAFILLAASLGWAMPAESYVVQEVPLPSFVAPEIGGLAFNSKGELVVVTRRSGVVIGKPAADPSDFEWRVFSATSMHNPMGVLLEDDSTMLIPQMAELTRVKDTDGDGVADTFMSVSRSWGVSGNYHETNAGPIPDGEGNWFIAVGTASHNGPTFTTTRGEFSAMGRRGRNYSAVPYKGWVVKITPEGGLIPWASGFRANNGITKGPDGNIWVTDNQGDWRGTSPIYHIEKGNFYGHPSSLVWDENWTKDEDVIEYAVNNLEEMDSFRTRAAVELPQGDMCNSPAEPIFDTTGGNFGPFTGQMFVGDIAGRRVLRVMLEEVNGTYQGACIKFMDGHGLRGGNNRFVFSPDGGALYVGQTYRGWGSPAEGLQRIVWKGKIPFEVKDISITRDGFDLTFTKAVDPESASKTGSYNWKNFHYDYTHAYGGPKRDLKDIGVESVRILDGGKRVSIALENMERHKLYHLNVDNLKSADGEALVHDELYYTVNVLR